MSTKVALLVNSCDLYEDAWEPFFTLFNKYWPDFPYPVYLNTETKAYDGNTMNVKTIMGGREKTWSERLLHALSEIDSEYILFFLEDFFLMSPVNTKVFQEALDTMEANANVGVISCVPDVVIAEITSVVNDLESFSPIKRKCRFRVNAMTALWRKKFLLSLVDKRENAWQFEINCTKRAFWRKEEVLTQNKNKKRMFDYHFCLSAGYGITQRKWLPKNKELFERHHIQCDFQKLGVLQITPKRKKRTKKELLAMAIKNPVELCGMIRNKLTNAEVSKNLRFYISVVSFKFKVKK